MGEDHTEGRGSTRYVESRRGVRASTRTGRFVMSGSCYENADDSMSLFEQPSTRHHYVERTKGVESGQYRVYFAAGCSCGWRTDQFRVTSDRAHDDWTHHGGGS